MFKITNLDSAKSNQKLMPRLITFPHVERDQLGSVQGWDDGHCRPSAHAWTAGEEEGPSRSGKGVVAGRTQVDYLGHQV